MSTGTIRIYLVSVNCGRHIYYILDIYIYIYIYIYNIYIYIFIYIYNVSTTIEALPDDKLLCILYGLICRFL